MLDAQYSCEGAGGLETHLDYHCTGCPLNAGTHTGSVAGSPVAVVGNSLLESLYDSILFPERDFCRYPSNYTGYGFYMG